MDYRRALQEYLDEETSVIQSLELDTINTVINVLERVRLSENNIFLYVAMAEVQPRQSHYCCDFNKGVSGKQQKKYNFECLNDNIPTMMAVANDIGYEEIFRFPLKNKMKQGDILIGVSGSGNSKNIINAMEYAKSIGNKTISIVGYDGGRMKEIADYCIHVNIHNMQIAEDIHMIFGSCNDVCIVIKRTRGVEA